jgi:hypothetical protein
LSKTIKDAIATPMTNKQTETHKGKRKQVEQVVTPNMHTQESAGRGFWLLMTPGTLVISHPGAAEAKTSEQQNGSSRGWQQNMAWISWKK